MPSLDLREPFKPPTEMFMATLDGPDPAQWSPWGPNAAWRVVADAINAVPIKVPSKQAGAEVYRFQIVYLSAVELDGITDWSRFTGVIFDPKAPKVVNAHAALVNRIARVEGPRLADKVGYHLIAVTDPDPSQDDIDVIDEVKRDAIVALAHAPIVQPVYSVDALRAVVRLSVVNALRRQIAPMAVRP